jgi:hypothetical protein
VFWEVLAETKNKKEKMNIVDKIEMVSVNKKLPIKVGVINGVAKLRIT